MNWNLLAGCICLPIGIFSFFMGNMTMGIINVTLGAINFYMANYRRY